MTARDIAFVGLGAMGWPMARHLVLAGHRVTVANRTPAKARAWAEANPGAAAAATTAEACAGKEFVIACVGTDDDVRETARAAFPVMEAGGLFIDHTTTSATLARDLAAEAARHGHDFVDAPVSGGQSGAEQGRLAIMAGGAAAAFTRAEPVMAAYAYAMTHMGPSGTGQLTKMVNQLCIAGLLQGLSEGLAFGERAGLDMERVLGVIVNGAARSWQMETRGPTMLQDRFDFGFAVDWMRKDLGLCFDEAARTGAVLPVARLVDGFYAEVQAGGGGRLDTSSLIRRLRGAGGEGA